MTSRPRTTSPSRKISLRRKKQKTDDRISGRPFFCLVGKGELCHLSVTADAVPPPLKGRQRGAKAPLEGSCRRSRLRGVAAPSKRRRPSATAERLLFISHKAPRYPEIPAIPVSGGSVQTRLSAAFRSAAAYCRLPTLYPHAPPYSGSGSSGSPAYSVFAASSPCRTTLRWRGR